MVNLEQVEGRKFCVVFVKVVDQEKERFQVQCFRGRASVERGELKVIDENNNAFTVPKSAHPTVNPNDGTKLLGDAEYFAMVKVDPNIELSSEKGGTLPGMTD